MRKGQLVRKGLKVLLETTEPPARKDHRAQLVSKVCQALMEQLAHKVPKG